jgi:hypothetical protein
MANGQAGQKRQAEAQTLTPDQMEAAKKWVQLVAKARSDKTLKQRLMDTPVVVLQEHGMKVRPGLDVRVVESTDKVAYLMLPSDSELSDSDLDKVTGGSDLSDAAQGALNAFNKVLATCNLNIIIGMPIDLSK